MASRPIPISNGRGSQRSSPASDLMSPTGVLVSQSLPADVHHVHHSRFLMVAGRNGAAARFQPPLAPAFGSLPAPSFVEDLPMEELSLPPPSLPRVQEQAVRPASVIEVREIVKQAEAEVLTWVVDRSSPAPAPATWATCARATSCGIPGAPAQQFLAWETVGN